MQMRILPPHLFYGSIALIVVVNVLFAGFKPVSSPWNWGVGLLLAILGLSMNLPSAGLFRSLKTNLIPYNDPDVLVTTGWFRFTRNPMYLGFVVILLGVAVGLGSIYGYVVPVAFAVIIDRSFIRIEEKAMSRVFDQAYEDYRSKVRRWI
jgi:protein-S-isoprenylcysteine O-methyltransferase Ste14